MMRRTALAATVVCALLASAPGACAASTFTVRGAGFGHGVGMSQYGALGYAQHGAGYAEILGHYYSGTALGTAPVGRQVRVLLQSPQRSVSFSGASQAGTKTLDPARTYRAVRHGLSQIELRSSAGKHVATFTAPLQVAGPEGTVTLAGRALNGRSGVAYRGILELHPTAFGLSAINQLGL